MYLDNNKDIKGNVHNRYVMQDTKIVWEIVRIRGDLNYILYASVLQHFTSNIFGKKG